MGLSCSRLGSRPSRGARRPTNGTKRTMSSLFICGASTSNAPVDEMEDDPAKLILKSAEADKLVANKFRNPRKVSAETAVTSESGVVTIDGSSFEDTSGSVQTGDKGKCLSKNKELVPPHRSSIDYTSCSRASTSYEDRTSSVLTSSNAMVNDLVNKTEDIMNKDASQTCLEVTQPSSLSPDGPTIENHEIEVTAVYNSDSGSSSVVSDSPLTFDSIREDALNEATPSDGNFLHVDVVSISSNILPSGTADSPARESRRNSRRLFWDAFSRRSSRRHSDSRTFLFSTDDADELGSHDRWLLDFGSNSLEDGVRGDSRYLGRTHGMNERRRHSRSEIWERLRGGLDGVDRRTNICTSGLHPDGTCSCESILMAEDSGPHASISRIVMLAEALFEVLDEIHRQPVSFSLSMVSLPAPESVVDALPVKNHKNTHSRGSDAEQCHICLSEYEEGDKIRVLPCHHEYHLSCVDKWLKEIHGVCPLCRGDVRESLMESSVSNPEISSA